MRQTRTATLPLHSAYKEKTARKNCATNRSAPQKSDKRRVLREKAQTTRTATQQSTKMSHPAVTYEDAVRILGQLPSLAPRPTATNIRALVVDLVDKLTIIPSEQSAEFGYSGMVQHYEIYALNSNNAWEPWGDPGPHRAADPNWTSQQQKDAEVLYESNKKVFDSEANVRRAVIAGLNAAVPRAYKRGTGTTIGVKVYRPTDNPKEILNSLRNMYGKMSPGEKTAMDQRWSAPWNAADPIEELFDRFEDCYVLALSNKPEFTADQMIDKALRAIQATGVYSIAILEWNAFDENNKTWPEFKAHFSEAYEVQLQSGAGTGNPYHGASNAVEAEDDDSIGSITQSITNMQLANNANAQHMSDTMNSITNEMGNLSSLVVCVLQINNGHCSCGIN